jgi:hypothetical protein
MLPIQQHLNALVAFRVVGPGPQRLQIRYRWPQYFKLAGPKGRLP